jgi:hypothetical protein
MESQRQYQTYLANQRVVSQQIRPQYDNQYMKHVGWRGTVIDSANYYELWCDRNLKTMQDKITQLLQGVSLDGRDIIVPLDTIGNVLSQVYQTNSPKIGCIYSRYIQYESERDRNDLRDIVDRAINIIVSSIRNEYDTIACNNKLTVWNALYGANDQGTRAHPPLKINKKTGGRFFQFHMNY